MKPVYKIVIKVLATIIVLACAFYFLVLPKLSELAENQVAIEEISSDLAAADAKLNQLKKIDKNKTELTQTKTLVDGYLPNDQSASGFILNIEQTASQIPIIVESLSINEIKAAATAAKTTDSETATSTKATDATAKTTTKAPEKEKALTFSASIKTSYDKILIYLRKMEELPRFNTIETISIGGYNKNDANLDLRAEGKIYYAK